VEPELAAGEAGDTGGFSGPLSSRMNLLAGAPTVSRVSPSNPRPRCGPQFLPKAMGRKMSSPARAAGVNDDESMIPKKPAPNS
jgi:hypothetical protein